MKKVGIITHYYKSLNYGGNLQAFALCKCLQRNGYEAEQISFESKFTNKQYSKKRDLVSFVKRAIKKVFGYPFRKYATTKAIKEEKKTNVNQIRQDAFYQFNQEIIPHSQIVYNNVTIQETVNKYDVFITGSDQVWNLNWYNEAYFLDFVPSTKKKIAYAASLACDQISIQNQKIIKESLKSFKAISLREKSANDLIQPLTKVDVCNVLDPTLLLSFDEWEQIREEVKIEKKYIFCYFLGNNMKARKIAKLFAKKLGLEIVIIPHATGDVEFSDIGYGDIKLLDMSPQKFLSLIKNTEYVFTDSFHAVIFSYIYKKQYFVFHRTKKQDMSSRITDITKLFNTEKNFCCNKKKCKLSYLLNLEKIDYERENEQVKIKKEFSERFLLNNLEN